MNPAIRRPSDSRSFIASIRFSEVKRAACDEARPSRVNQATDKLARWIPFRDDLLKLCKPWIRGGGLTPPDREQFSPMWPGRERRERLLNHRQQFLDRRPVLLPGKVNSNRPALVTGAEPKFIGSNGAQFGHQQVRR